MLLFLQLLLAHILGDFIFQNEKWIKHKQEKKIKSIKLYYHIGIHAILLLVILWSQRTNYWLVILIIIVTHYGIDLLKLYCQNKTTQRRWFFIDQILHILVLLIIVQYYYNFLSNLDSYITSKNLLLLTFILVVTHVSAVSIKIIITQWSPENTNIKEESLEKAGRYIGIIERIFVFTFIIINHWEAIGFLLAAKSIFRFGDLTSAKDRKLTEYVLIGTLLSFGFAIALGLIYLKIKLLL